MKTKSEASNILFSGCMDMKSTALDRPIERIREACGLVGYDFEHKLPDLEIYLEGLVADGEDDEGRLTVAGLTFLSKSSSENPTT